MERLKWRSGREGVLERKVERLTEHGSGRWFWTVGDPVKGGTYTGGHTVGRVGVQKPEGHPSARRIGCPGV